MAEFEPGVKSAEELKDLLEKTGSRLEGTVFTEKTVRKGMEDVRVIEVEKADGETFFHPISE